MLGNSPLRFDPLASCCQDCSHCFDSSEVPSTLEKIADRTKPTRRGKKPPRTTAPCVVCPRLLRHRDPHRTSSIAKSATLLFHELSRARALKAFGDHLEFDVAGVRHLARSFLYDFGVVIPSQPRCQFPLNSLPVRDAESSRAGRPPIWNAFVAHEQTVVEERARFRGAEKLPALGAALDAKQSQGPNQIVEIVLNP